jgi:general nucleoside transport system ATP-binding protein
LSVALDRSPAGGVGRVADPEAAPVVSLRGITKIFPGLIANDAVDFEIRAGEIHALLGENGAGKSTLMNVLTGIYQPDAGQILLDGQPTRFVSPAQAIGAGIGMIHQHFKLIQAFTVAENIHLGWGETPLLISASDIEAHTRVLAEKFNLAVRPEARIDEISAGEQQRVEILKVLARGARILILDEPTAVLTPPEARELFKALRQFRAAGNSVVFISHKLDEVLAISDRITILRAGKKVALREAAGCTPGILANLMVGRDVVLHHLRAASPHRADPGEPPPMVLQNVSALNDRNSPGLTDIDLELRAGEILGIAGVAGNGQRELSEVLTGVRPIRGGDIVIAGYRVPNSNPAMFRDAGIGHIPEDRLRSGLAPSLSIIDNAVLREYVAPPIARGPFIDHRSAAALAERIAKDAEVGIPSFQMPVRNLSGGNQQRLVARREMRIAKKVLIAAYPTRGLDVGAINTMVDYLAALRDSGVAVVMFSEELEELLNLADRIAVLYEGRIMGIFDAKGADMEEIGLLMGGKTKHGERVA